MLDITFCHLGNMYQPSLIEEILPEHVINIVIEKDVAKGFDYRKITVEGKE